MSVSAKESCANRGGDPFDLARVLPFLCLVLVSGIRCFVGLDVTDEMQYQGQILGLIESGRLFSTDLFIQQLVYLLFLPVFKLYHLLFGEVAFVLFGRVLLALVLIALYGVVRQALLRLGSTRWQAAVAAFAVTFAVPYHGIFALSYNTLSQCAWVVFAVWYLDPLKVSPWRWVALLVLAGFAHPVAAFAMAGLLAMALLQGRAVKWAHWGVAALVGLFFCVVLLFSFTSLADLSRSLAFSRGFGVGGGALWSHAPSLYSIAAYIVAMAVLAWLPIGPRQLWVVCAIVLSGLMIWAGRHLVRGHWSYGYTVELAQVAGLIAMGAHLLARLSPGVEATGSRPVLNALGRVGVVHFLVLVGTSSNGLTQGLGALMLTIPLACALVSVRPESGQRWAAVLLSIPLWLAMLLALIHWSVAPYRDRPWYRQDRGASDVPAFRYLSVSAPNLALLDAYRHEVGNEVNGQQALIASERPALYLALGARPQTCMLYMHSAGNAVSSAALAQCLASRRPEVILDVLGGEAEHADTPLRRIIREQVALRGMTCRVGQVHEHWIHASLAAGPVRYRLCTLATGLGSGR
jgi:hypothetical protein